MTRRRLSSAAVAVITVMATLAGVAILVVAIAALVAAALAPSTRVRFSAGSAGPSCSRSGDKVELRYPIASSQVPYSIYNAPRVRPDHLSGLEYIAVDTDPSSPPDHERLEPQYRDLKVTDGSTVIISLRLEGRNGSADGLQFDWAEGEPAYTQTLPLTLRVTSTGCTVR